MIMTFSDKNTENVFNGIRSAGLPPDVQDIMRRKLRMIDSAKVLSDLKLPPGNRLEQLKGKQKEFCSIRINDKWRIVFRFKNGGAYDVRITDYH